MMKYNFFKTVAMLIAFAACTSQEEEKSDRFVADGVALGGFDPVAYFVQQEAKKGSEKESAMHQGLTYYFSSTKNRLLFIENPERYLPEYGGWCAYAIAETSTKMEPDPTQWKIQDGKLLLFYDDWMTQLTGSLLKTWNEDSISYKSQADQRWVEMKK